MAARDELARTTVNALVGESDGAREGRRELFADAVEQDGDLRAAAIVTLIGTLGDDRYLGSRRVGEAAGVGERRRYLGCEFHDVAFGDWRSLLRLEPMLSRHHWLALVSCYLRIVIPMSALVQTRGVVLIDRWLRAALRGEDIPSEQLIETSLVQRGRGLLKPTRELCSDHLEAISEYMRARVRLSVLLHDLADEGILSAEDIARPLVAKRVPGREEGGIHQLLQRVAARRLDYARAVRNKLDIGDVLDFADRLGARMSEQFPAWRNPLKAGPGKLLRELMYPMYCIGQFDERGSHLLVQPSRKLKFTIQPGPLVLQFVTLMRSMHMTGTVARPTVLRDIEEHLQAYGVDYAGRPQGRSVLVSQMRDIGLLVGSADAGESARIRNPYQSIIRGLQETGVQS